jgi:sec-independent protein translocase protein TatC
MAASDRTDHSEDYFAESRMSFGDHIDELRIHLWRAIVGFAFCLMIGFVLDGIGTATGWPIGVGVPAMKFIQAPVVEQLEVFYAHRLEQVREDMKSDPTLGGKNSPSEFNQQGFSRAQLMALFQGKSSEVIEAIDKPVDQKDIVKLWMRHEQPVEEAGALQKAQWAIGRRPGLSTLSITEAFMVYFKVCMLCGIILSSPWVFYHIWSFIAAGLYAHEKRLVNVYLPVSLGLFLGGICMCQFLVMPRAVAALLWFNEWLGLEPDLRLNEWLGFAIMMPLVFGVTFQTPLVMFFLERIGVMSVQMMQSSRKLAIFLMAVFTAIITPTPDALTMIFLWIPMCLLYELGIIMCRLNPRPVFEDSEEPEETIEV